jgi:hypothetical protein
MCTTEHPKLQRLHMAPTPRAAQITRRGGALTDKPFTPAASPPPRWPGRSLNVEYTWNPTRCETRPRRPPVESGRPFGPQGGRREMLCSRACLARLTADGGWLIRRLPVARRRAARCGPVQRRDGGRRRTHRRSARHRHPCDGRRDHPSRQKLLGHVQELPVHGCRRPRGGAPRRKHGLVGLGAGIARPSDVIGRRRWASPDGWRRDRHGGQPPHLLASPHPLQPCHSSDDTRPRSRSGAKMGSARSGGRP